MNELYKENRDYILAFAVVTMLCLAGAWLVHDYGRNEPVYNNTDSTMADIDARIGSIEQRIDSLQSRVDKAEKAVSGTLVTIRESRENAVTVADGITGAEERLDRIIQRQGRIANIIAGIEGANRKGAQDTSKAGMAK